MLTVENLACERGGRRLFEKLNLDLGAGQCVEVRGANGSGKSTLLRAIAGLFPDYEGSVKASACFYLGHRPAVSALLSPRENLQWYERLSLANSVDTRAEATPGIREALAAVAMEAWSEIPCGQLSQGQQRRVALARALMYPGRLWLLDEPLTALDTDGRALAGRFVAEHCAAGGGVLCATHQTLGCADTRVIDLGQGG